MGSLIYVAMAIAVPLQSYRTTQDCSEVRLGDAPREIGDSAIHNFTYSVYHPISKLYIAAVLCCGEKE
jgi:hypothetical protein